MQAIERQSRKRLLSQTEPTNYHQVQTELNTLQKELSQKQALVKFATSAKTILPDPTNLEDYLAQLRKEETYEQMQSKLGQVRELIAANDLEKLKEWYEQGKL